MKRQQAKTTRIPSRTARRAPAKVRPVDPATQDTRAVRFGTGAISPTLRK